MDELCSLDPQAGEGTVRAALSEVRETYATGGHGVELVEIAQGWQFLSRREYAEAIDRAQFALRPRRLSPAALETLAIIPYRQPRGRRRGGAGLGRRSGARAHPPGRAARASRAADVARPQQADRLRRQPRRPARPAHGFRPSPEGARPHVRWTAGRDDLRPAAAHHRRGGGAPADASPVRRAPYVLAARARPLGARGRAGPRRRGRDRRPAGADRPAARARGRARRRSGGDAGRGPAAHRAPPGGGIGPESRVAAPRRVRSGAAGPARRGVAPAAAAPRSGGHRATQWNSVIAR